MTADDRCPVCHRTLAEAGPHMHGDAEIARLAALKPLTDAELDEIAVGRNWRAAKCRECGRESMVTPDLRVVACACPSPLEAGYDAPPRPSRIVQTPAGPLATDRLVAEVRRLRLTPAELAQARLVSEIRRLRAPGWIEAAAREIAIAALNSGGESAADPESVEAVIRKHRDGRA